MGARPEPQVLYVDNHVLALHKPSGMPCVPDSSGDPSLLDWGRDWVGREFQKPGNVFLGVVHRLDRPVSGVVVFGRTSKGASRLSDSLRRHDLEKIYWSVLPGKPSPSEGRVNHWLLKDPSRNQVRVLDEESHGAKWAQTSYRFLAEQGSRTLVELIPHTGRPHQLRVAMASLGLPLLGDLRYGARDPLPDRSVALHAVCLRIPHPTRDESIRLLCPPPELDVWSFAGRERMLEALA
ncbi:MAG: RluA family pseudouridine synthase [Planctomycetes bacterium]|nr:RluA family pseudouridine synthase [Planctomycetota bacterium]